MRCRATPRYPKASEGSLKHPRLPGCTSTRARTGYPYGVLVQCSALEVLKMRLYWTSLRTPLIVILIVAALLGRGGTAAAKREMGH
eukprot:3072841-Rhodomonas_salina.2